MLRDLLLRGRSPTLLALQRVLLRLAREHAAP